MIGYLIIHAPGCFVIEVAACPYFCGHLRQFKLDYLERGQGGSELFPAFDMADRLFQRCPAKSHPLGCDVKTGPVEKSHEFTESFTLGSDQVFLWHPHIAKDKFRSV